jgi:hypothetical protein
MGGGGGGGTVVFYETASPIPTTESNHGVFLARVIVVWGGRGLQYRLRGEGERTKPAFIQRGGRFLHGSSFIFLLAHSGQWGNAKRTSLQNPIHHPSTHPIRSSTRWPVCLGHPMLNCFCEGMMQWNGVRGGLPMDAHPVSSFEKGIMNVGVVGVTAGEGPSWLRK